MIVKRRSSRAANFHFQSVGILHENSCQLAFGVAILAQDVSALEFKFAGDPFDIVGDVTVMVYADFTGRFHQLN